MEDKYYSTDEVAEVLGLSRRTVYNYIKAGQLQGVKIGKSWRFPEKELKRFVTHGTSPLYTQILFGEK